MTLAAGTRLGPYQIVAPIGAGGMGEVYRARDTRLDRDVAVKVLPGSVASDREAVARFEREARAVAALSHPSILSLHDFGSQDGVVFAVTELLEGRTLGTLLEEGPLPPRRAAAISREIAEGLAAAHSKGIVHRDLKPENVFVSKEGHAKILDFGLARDLRVSAKEDTSAPTERPLTEPGAVMGTVGYMSPEQVRGAPLDHRSDIFSFGAVLYEMLAGSRAFRKPTAAETMTAILKEDPPELASTSGLALSLDQVARRCLEKSPDARFQDTRDLVFAIEMATEGASRPGAQQAASPNRKFPLGILAGALAVLLAAGGAWLAARKSRAPEPPRFERVTFRRGFVRGARYTPDGRSVVYAAAWDGAALKVFLKAPESPDALPIDLPSANVLAVSPAGELAIALDCQYSQNGVCRGTLARVALTGGSPREIAKGVEHADFAKDGELAIVRDMPEAGRSRLEFPVGKTLYETNGHVSFPRVSPDGKRIAFFDHALRGDDAGFVAVVDLAGKKQVLTKRFTTARGLAWSPSGGEIWFTAADAGSRTLRAVSLSATERTLYRAPGTLRLSDVSRDGKILLSRDEERNGVLGAGPGETAERDLSWLELSSLLDLSHDGKVALLNEQGEAAGPDGVLMLRKMDGSPPMRLGAGIGQFSPDGKSVFVATLSDPAAPPKILPVGPGEPVTVKVDLRETLDGGWMPDSRRLIFYGAPTPGGQPFLLLLDPATGASRRLPVEGRPLMGPGLTPDSRYIVSVAGDGSLRLCPVDGGASLPLPGIQKDEFPLRFSGDGRSLFVLLVQGTSMRLALVDLKTGARSGERVVEPADKAGLAYLRNLVISADGSAYAYQYRRWLSDLYNVEGIR